MNADDDAEFWIRYWLRLCNWALIGTTVLFGSLAALNLYGAVDHNPQGEYCRYVTEGEPYHLRLEGDPCRLTAMSAFTFFVTYLTPAVPMQGVLVVVWVALRRRLKKVVAGR